jgi:hypothetical protein
VSLVEQELLTLPENLSLPPVFSGVRVTRSLVLYVCFVDRCLSFCIFSFGHCVVCSSSICGFWLPLWYLQTLLTWITIKGEKRNKCIAPLACVCFSLLTSCQTCCQFLWIAHSWLPLQFSLTFSTGNIYMEVFTSAISM